MSFQTIKSMKSFGVFYSLESMVEMVGVDDSTILVNYHFDVSLERGIRVRKSVDMNVYTCTSRVF